MSDQRDSNAHELQSRQGEELGTSRNEQSLPPADGGKAAWRVLVASSIVQAPTWGYPTAFAVLQQYLTYSDHEFRGQKTPVATVGTTLSGVLYLSSPFLFYILTRWPRTRKHFCPVGLVLSVVGFLASSFIEEIWNLILLQGVAVALGSNLIICATTLNLDEWWIRRKGLAFGLMMAAKSIVGAAFPLLFNAILQKSGFRMLLRVWGVIVGKKLVTTIPAILLSKPRIPLSMISRSRPISWSFLRSPSFWLLQTGNFVQSIGYMMPNTYYSSYATLLGLPPLTGTLILMLNNGCSVAGSSLLGLCNDHAHISTVILISTAGSVLAVFLLWGFAVQLPLFAIFAVAYGFFAGGYSSTWPGVSRELHNRNPSFETGMMYGLLAGGRGLGFVISGPLSSALLNTSLDGNAKGGYGTVYGSVIVCTGISAVLGGWGVGVRWFGRRR